MANALRLLIALTLAAGLVSCGGDDHSSAPPTIDPALANQLASESEEVAAALDQGRCAEPAARELERRADQAAVPVAVRNEVRRVLGRARISCPAAVPPPAPPPTPTPTPTPTVDGDDENGGHGRGKGHEKHEKHKKHGHGHGKDGGD